MIDEKKIEEAARNYAAEQWLSDSCVIASEEGFYDGIKWFKENLWHPISECNNKDFEDNVEVLAIETDGYMDIIISSELEKNQKKYIKWLYIEDLMGGSNEK